jgi:hypothetical protein
VEELDQTGRGDGGFGSTGMGVLKIDLPHGSRFGTAHDATYYIDPKFITNTTANVKYNTNS